MGSGRTAVRPDPRRRLSPLKYRAVHARQPAPGANPRRNPTRLTGARAAGHGHSRRHQRLNESGRPSWEHSPDLRCPARRIRQVQRHHIGPTQQLGRQLLAMHFHKLGQQSRRRRPWGKPQGYGPASLHSPIQDGHQPRHSIRCQEQVPRPLRQDKAPPARPQHVQFIAGMKRPVGVFSFGHTELKTARRGVEGVKRQAQEGLSRQLTHGERRLTRRKDGGRTCAGDLHPTRPPGHARHN